jgi:hypothetical protein
MTYPYSHLYLTWGGTIGDVGSAGDIWQCGVRFSRTIAGASLEATQGAVDAAATRLSAFHANANVYINEGAKLTFVKGAIIGTDGSYQSDPTVHTFTTPVSGSVTTSPTRTPPQAALAVTLWSGFTLGKGNYGRFFLPWFSGPISHSTGLFTGNAQQIATDAKNLLSGLQTDLGTDLDPDPEYKAWIFGETGVSGTGKAVIWVRVDTRVDTQRRRANRIDGAPYVSQLVTA